MPTTNMPLLPSWLSGEDEDRVKMIGDCIKEIGTKSITYNDKFKMGKFTVTQMIETPPANVPFIMVQRVLIEKSFKEAVEAHKKSANGTGPDRVNAAISSEMMPNEINVPFGRLDDDMGVKEQLIMCFQMATQNMKDQGRGVPFKLTITTVAANSLPQR